MKFLEYFTIITFALMCGSCIVRANTYDESQYLDYRNLHLLQINKKTGDGIGKKTGGNSEKLSLRTPVEIKEEVIQRARGKVKDLNTFMAVLDCESAHFTKMFHVNNNGSVDRGYFMINDKAHPDISDECAFNFDCALNFTLKLWNGRPSAYYCYTLGYYKKHLNL